MVVRIRVLVAAGLTAGLAWAAPGVALAEGVRTVPVTAYGSGSTEAEAAQNAVINAVAMVSGERIAASQSVDQSVRQRTDSSGQAAEQVTSEVRERISRLTRGVVKSWSIVSVKPQPEGTVHVTVSAQVAVYEGSASIKRFRLAIVPGRTASRASPLPESPLDALVSGLTESLVASRKFAVLDRRESEAADRELRLIESRRVPVEELARLQAGAAADALVVVNPLVERTGDDPRRPFRMVVELSVIDYASGQIKGSFTQSRRVSAETARSSAVQLGRALGNEVLEYAFPPLVIGMEADTLTIDAGDARFSVGDVVRLFRFGAPLKDPATGESRGFTELPLGEARIVHATPMISVARFERATAIAVDASNGIIVRRAADKGVDLHPPVQPALIDAAVPSARTSPSHNPRKRSSNDNDW